jgi:copper chaperone CopZ
LLIALLVRLSLRRLHARLVATPPPMADLTLRVQGMTCGHCVASVKRALEGCAAVEEATPELTSGLVQVRGRQLDLSTLVAAVEKVGFQATKAV